MTIQQQKETETRVDASEVRGKNQRAQLRADAEKRY